MTTSINCLTSVEGQGDVFPLLCDILPDGEGLLVMLKVYLDRGAKRDTTDGIMCVASVIFKPNAYKQFFRPWNRMLKAWGASAFHATDFYNGAEEFMRDTPYRKRLFEEDCKRIPKMVGHYVERISLISFRPDEFDRVASPEWKGKFGTSVHSHAVQLCLIANGWWRKEKFPSESFAYFMESGDTDEGKILQDVEGMRRDTESGTGSVIGIKSFSSVDKGVARGLEAADFSAWHWNKYYMDKIRAGEKDRPRKDFAAFVDAAEDKIEYMFLTDAHLKYFFSLVPKEALGMSNKNDEAIYLEAVPLEWISEPDNQQRAHQILSDNMDRLCGTSSKRESEKIPVPFCPDIPLRPGE